MNDSHKSIINAERIKQETKYFEKNYRNNFTVNPNSMTFLAEKPNNITPSKPYRDMKESYYASDPVGEAFSSEHLHKAFENQTKTPLQKYRIPQTSNQEIGWMNRPLTSNDRRWNKSRKSNAITQYADEYCANFGYSPFKVQK
eukprot:CAMPEP_0115008264 /NCGR_PEP_ID=MMETSP0216-20121206/21795_1 /TAXON_ID=223996 /ORGANISM="Protocruzia adherens, Strain Boccale" /LENGTH=142 /DNA_ID=CAMNT_0002375611 /DNA_START=114 /DNA_END=542 /DNA_ORIENTATION=+